MCWTKDNFFKIAIESLLITIGRGSLLGSMEILPIEMCVVNPVILFMISFLKPSTTLTVINITAMPVAIPIIPIFTIGLEMLPLL